MCPSSQRPQCVFQVEVPAARSAAATPLTVLPTLLTTRPRQVGTGVELAAKRYGADPRYQARALPRSLPSLALLPRACICFEPCLPTFRTRSRRPCTRLTSTPPRCSSQRWPAFAGPSRVAEKAGGIWPKGAVDCQSSSRASPEAGDPPASVLFCGCCILTATWYAPVFRESAMLASPACLRASRAATSKGAQKTPRGHEAQRS